MQGLVISNLFVSATGNTDQTAGTGIQIGDNSGTGSGNDLITNCIIHDVQNGIYLEYGTSTTNEAYTYCTAYNCN